MDEQAVNVISRVFNDMPNDKVEDIIKKIRESRIMEKNEIEKVNWAPYYPTSSAQKRMYALNQLENSGTNYNSPSFYNINGIFDIVKVKEVFKKLIKCHESLRTYFGLEGGELVQYICEDVDVDVNLIEIKAGEENCAMEHFVQPFNLGQAPLFRISVCRFGAEQHLLMFDIHHIICDGISSEILWREFSLLYRGKETPPGRIQYKDFVAWQMRLLSGDRGKEQKQYWLDKFQGDIPVLNLPTDHPRPAVQSFLGDYEVFSIDKELCKSIRLLMKETGATMYMVLMACFNVMLSKYSNQEDIIVGMPIAGRRHQDVEGIIGMFVNTLVIRNRPEQNLSFREFLNCVKENLLEAYENQDYQFEELVETLNIHRDTSHNPIFDVMFVMQNMEPAKLDIGLDTVPFINKSGSSKFDLTLFATEKCDYVEIGIEYSTDLFDKETILRMEEHFICLMRDSVSNLDKKLADLEMLPEWEKEKVQYGFNRTDCAFPEEKTIHQLFEECVARNPQKTALVYGNEKLSYGEVNSKANMVASVLRTNGVEADVIVGILIERSFDMVIGILGILKAGGAYLPIDPEYAEDRIAYMLKDSGADIIISQSWLKDKLVGFTGETIWIDMMECSESISENLPNINSPNDLAYVIYTSGSTGRPKGVAIEHRNVMNMIFDSETRYPTEENDAYLLNVNFCFDASVLELFSCLVGEGHLVLLNKGYERDPRLVWQTIIKYNVTHVFFVPSALRSFLYEMSDNEISSLKYVIIGGEEVTPEIVENFFKKFKNVKLLNIYGPTEGTVYAVTHLIDENTIPVPIGKPVKNYRVYMLNHDQKFQGIGIPGELCIAGSGVGRGYLDNEDLNKAKFTTDPLRENERMYHTGDLARWRSNGTIEYLGRIDRQVKIRGYRIELGEIEYCLRTHPAVRDAVVLAIEESNGNKHLRGCIIPQKEITALELRSFLGNSLPVYMIPDEFSLIDVIPKLSSGKIDNNKLEQIKNKLDKGGDYGEPNNPKDEILLKIWKKVLSTVDISINDNFFDVGGHSLKAIVLSSLIEKEIGIKLNFEDIIKNPTIRAQRKLLESPSNTCEKEGDIFITFNHDKEHSIFTFPPMFSYGIAYKEMAGRLENYSFYCFNFLDEEDRNKTYSNYIVNLGKKPIIFIGYSAGGILAYDLINYLEKKGVEVSKLILIDSYVNNNDISTERLELIKNYYFKLHSLEVTDSIEEKINAYARYYSTRKFDTPINTNIYCVVSENSEIDIDDYRCLTTKGCHLYQGYGSHLSMLTGKALLKNTELIKKIIETKL